MKKVGLLGGTYDPIHVGHINFAKHALEKASLDEILFCPANHSPEKTDRLPKASGQDRLEMVRLAIAEYPRMTAIDLELKRPGPSYTIDTVRTLCASRSPGDQLFLLMGKHIAERIDCWKEAKQLLELAPPIIAIRPGGTPPEVPEPFKKLVANGVIEVPPIEVSSSEIRERLHQKESCEELVPAKVLDYIRSRGLY